MQTYTKDYAVVTQANVTTVVDLTSLNDTELFNARKIALLNILQNLPGKKAERKNVRSALAACNLIQWQPANGNKDAEFIKFIDTCVAQGIITRSKNKNLKQNLICLA